ncbi:MAG TPA: hypothetical protein ENH62_00350 [Marinobacter sp.]|nr:hypothetical protein [Marinobacter sp.]|tara:strand:- start:990 stop:1328 length:339 start_codon:yes stop_codon:yes gene_type:complete
MVVELTEPGRNPERNTGRRGAMRCPVCDVALSMSDRQGIEIDFCPDCRGVWLDRGELDKIIERSIGEATPPPPPTRDDDERGYRSGKHGGGHHGGYGKHGSRRKSWLHGLFD